MSRDTEHPKADDVLDLRASRQSLTSAEVEDLEDLALGEDYALNPDFVAMVVDAIDRGDAERLRELLAALHPADVADLMGFLSSDHRSEVVAHLDPEALAEILSELDTEIREDVLEHVPSAILAKALGEMDSDDAVDVVDDLEDDKRAQVLAALPEMERSAIESSLAYEDETAGRLMQREVVWAPQFWTVGQTIDHFLKEADELPELFFDVYVVDPAHKPVGAVPVSHLLRTRRDAPLAQVMEAITEIPVEMDQEEVAYIFDKYHLISAPVVEPGGRLVGQITVDDIVGVIQDESEEDILALAGVSDAGRDAGVLGIVRSRLPWLILNLLTATVAVSVIAAFQNEIAKLVTLAILMPIVAGVGGNAGTQTLAVAVRALASRELNASNAMRIFLREICVGMIDGAVLGSVMSTAVFLWFHDLRLSLTVGLALIVNVSIAAVVGTLVPLTLDRLGRDPAVSSSVFVTFATDSMGFLSFLGLAAVILL
ncbi:MAG: magnesium transporter [Phenylobacterium sp.]|jgi:magnesium transporter|uniref:magnesium transporter n=1 Tax=Phenylobacterium sp. TaxID=1871053 RepID=UPI001B68481F|nr:magnesium transporter [Phenylobacterium sp.]MBP7648824.1 magnesium transporter [Phenylobacterium sp.]MBP7814986.1 magnesium transporter [Phenylobacterium sp.]MBP9230097.1 magnesium transporter [Phenylobacterium sp.]MBP9756851.1 magnesium transporter [Phenylobacterium sp.]